MKIPSAPPTFEELFNLLSDKQQFAKIITSKVDIFIDKKYLHWDKLQHLTPPEGLSLAEWWLGLKIRRRAGYMPIPLKDVSGNSFQYLLAGPIHDLLHQIDLGAGGTIEMPDQITNPETKDRYYVNSLIEEAINSSQMEGAATTRKVAEGMIRRGRRPRDKGERMIMNNFLAMKRINAIKKEPLTKELVFEIFNMVTKDTLDNPNAVNRFRNEDDNIHVVDPYGEILHRPPPADQLEERMAALCDFANGKTPEDFVHPVIRSILLHFWLSYIHPFVDGNGRTARALFYWSMLRYDYWLCEYISISSIIHKAPAKYGMAFLCTETDDNDLTYFIHYHLKVIQRAVNELHEYLQRKTSELQKVERNLRGMTRFNHRQQAIISHALRHPNHRYTIHSHQMSHQVVHQTARTDLLGLVEHGIFISQKIGKQYFFSPAVDMADKLAKFPA
jgi:Fic family protein